MTREQPPERCDHDQLTRFGAGELGPEDREHVEAHLVDCEACWDDVRISRAAITAVQRLYEPAPTALRAEVRATIAVAARANAQSSGVRSQRLVLVAVAVVLLTLSGVTMAVLSSRSRHSESAESTRSGSSGFAEPIRAAVADFGATAPRDATAAAAPDLRALGLKHRSAATVELGGAHVVRYVYTDPAGARLEVLVGAAAWVRPAGAARVGAKAWATTRAGLTLIGGPDPARDQMLVITQDHATAVSAATSLGVT